jgi:hypothetical protein
LLFIGNATAKYAAGILPYTTINGQCHVLLGKESRCKWKIFKRLCWSDFGGSQEAGDNNNIKYTAAREFSEETNAVYGNGNIERSITYILPKLDNCLTVSDGKYTMHLVEVPYKKEQVFLDAASDTSEKIDFIWIPMLDLYGFVCSERSLITTSMKESNVGIFDKMVKLLESPTGLVALETILQKTDEIDLSEANKPLQHKNFLQKTGHAIKSILSFKPVLKVTSLFH